MTRRDVLPTGAAQPIGWGSTVEEIDGIRVNAEGAMIVGDLLNGGRYLPEPTGDLGDPTYGYRPAAFDWHWLLAVLVLQISLFFPPVLRDPCWCVVPVLWALLTLARGLRVHSARRAYKDALRRLETARARRVAAGPDRLKPEGDEKAASVRVAAEAGLPYLDYESGEIWPPERAQGWLARHARIEALSTEYRSAELRLTHARDVQNHSRVERFSRAEAEGWKPWPVDKARRTLEAIIKDARLVSRDRARGALTADQAESLLLDFSGEVQEGVLRAEIPSGPATAALKHFALTRKMLTTETERGDGR